MEQTDEGNKESLQSEERPISDNERDNKDRDPGRDRSSSRSVDSRRDDRKRKSHGDRDRDRSHSRTRRGNGEQMTTSLLVRNLSFNIRPSELKRLFSKHGEVRDVYIPEVSLFNYYIIRII